MHDLQAQRQSIPTAVLRLLADERVVDKALEDRDSTLRRGALGGRPQERGRNKSSQRPLRLLCIGSSQASPLGQDRCQRGRSRKGPDFNAVSRMQSLAAQLREHPTGDRIQCWRLCETFQWAPAGKVLLRCRGWCQSKRFPSRSQLCEAEIGPVSYPPRCFGAVLLPASISTHSPSRPTGDAQPPATASSQRDARRLGPRRC